MGKGIPFNRTLYGRNTFQLSGVVGRIFADATRGVLITAMYARVIGNSSFKTAIYFGIASSFLAGTLSVIYPFISKPVMDWQFLIDETSILILQGLFSGIALGIVYISDDKQSNT